MCNITDYLIDLEIKNLLYKIVVPTYINKYRNLPISLQGRREIDSPAICVVASSKSPISKQQT